MFIPELWVGLIGGAVVASIFWVGFALLVSQHKNARK